MVVVWLEWIVIGGWRVAGGEGVAGGRGGAGFQDIPDRWCLTEIVPEAHGIAFTHFRPY